MRGRREVFDSSSSLSSAELFCLRSVFIILPRGHNSSHALEWPVDGDRHRSTRKQGWPSRPGGGEKVSASSASRQVTRHRPRSHVCPHLESCLKMIQLFL